MIGWVATVAVGASLGLLGGGGSILTVPLLVYLFGVGVTAATAYSLVLVGITSVAGAALHARRGTIDLHSALPFALPSVATAYLTRRLLVPRLPDPVPLPFGLSVALDRGLMLLFAALMVAVAARMFREDPAADCPARRSPGILAILGAAVGAVAALLGAGGGFLIVPALVLVAGLRMHAAVGTSLGIIALQSAAAVAGALGDGTTRFDWPFLAGLTAASLCGLALGLWRAPGMRAASLRRAFAVLVLAVAAVIVLHELTV
jgi:uncharacterized membrane protein YfcA